MSPEEFAKRCQEYLDFLGLPFAFKFSDGIEWIPVKPEEWGAAIVYAMIYGYELKEDKMGVPYYGCTNYENRNILVAQSHFEAVPAISVETVIHEAAHALLGPNEGHNDLWAVRCRELGGTGDKKGYDVDKLKQIGFPTEDVQLALDYAVIKATQYKLRGQ